MAEKKNDATEAATPKTGAVGGASPQEAEIARLKAELAKKDKEIDSLLDGGASKPVELEQGEFAKFEKLAAIFGEAVAKAMRPPEPGARVRPPKPPLPDEFKGTRQYYVGPGKAYQGNRLFQKGEIITVTNQRPARDWTPVVKGQPAPKVSKPPTGRASDLDIDDTKSDAEQA